MRQVSSQSQINRSRINSFFIEVFFVPLFTFLVCLLYGYTSHAIAGISMMMIVVHFLFL